MACKAWTVVNASSVGVLTGELSKLSSTKAQCRLSSSSLHSSPISFSLQSSNVSFSLRSLGRRACGAVAAEMAATKTPLKLEKVKLTKQQLEKAKHEMDKFVQSIPGNPEKRQGAAPYYLLHKEGESVYGTVLMFHGFSATTSQMCLLAQYLYENGFNVYQPGLCGHYFVNPDKHWPQVDFKSSIKKHLVEKLMADPNLSSTLKNFVSISLLTKQKVQETLDCVKDEVDLLKAINDEEFSSTFFKVYESQHMNYIHEAEQRLKEIHALPGPIFTVGLSMGGATALALAATHPNEIAKTAVFAPLFKITNQTNRRFSTLMGPLGAREGGWYPDMPFSLKCFVAVDVFGHFVREPQHLDSLAKMPTMIVQTEIDDSADHNVGVQIVEEIRRRGGKGGPPHFSTLYTAAERVPHTMIHPMEVSQGTINQNWQSCYQEVFRFLTQGDVHVEHLHSKDQDPALPQVASCPASYYYEA